MSEHPPAAAGRGILLIVAAVVIGFLLLSQGLDDSAPASLSVDTPDAADDGGSDEGNGDGGGQSTETTVAVVPPGTPAEQVPVVVANGSGVSGAAGFFTEQLRSGGYTSIGEPTNTNENAQLDSVFYTDDGTRSWQAEAEGVAAALGLDPTTVVLPLDPAAPPAEIGNNTVLVVVGEAGTLASQVSG